MNSFPLQTPVRPFTQKSNAGNMLDRCIFSQESLTNSQTSGLPEKIGIISVDIDHQNQPPFLVAHARSIIKHLVLLMKTKKNGVLSPLVPVSYTRYQWVSLTGNQKAYVKTAWNSLSDSERSTITQKVLMEHNSKATTAKTVVRAIPTINHNNLLINSWDNKLLIHRLGKLMPKGTGRDTGILGGVPTVANVVTPRNLLGEISNDSISSISSSSNQSSSNSKKRLRDDNEASSAAVDTEKKLVIELRNYRGASQEINNIVREKHESDIAMQILKMSEATEEMKASATSIILSLLKKSTDRITNSSK